MAGIEKGMAIGKIAGICEKIAPLNLAAEWDNNGLIIGDPSTPLKGIVVALDATDAAVDLAESTGANLMIVHHPLIFSPLNRIETARPVGGLISRLIKNNIALFAMHTNLDSAPKGLNEHVAKLIGLKKIAPLQLKEVTCRIGRTASAVDSGSFAVEVKKRLGLNSVRHYGPRRKIEVVALCTGSGGDNLEEAADAGADLLVTGDVRHHHGITAENLGIPVIDAGHVGTERPMVELVTAFLKKSLTKTGKRIRIIPFIIDELYENY
jgi:dinuclear metal center YbgI/SA1388 family protein